MQGKVGDRRNTNRRRNVSSRDVYHGELKGNGRIERDQDFMTKPRKIQELLATDDPAWPLVQGWIKSASFPVEVLPANWEQRDQVLLESQVTLRSPLGAIIYETGGLLIDCGWLRVLGGGHEKLRRTVASWNRDRSSGFALVADDVVGGFFAINGGALGPDLGKMFYFAPDTLRWEAMNGMGYSQFLVWAMSPALNQFYASMRWDGWEQEASKISGDQVLSMYPFPWTLEGKDTSKCSRRACAIEEIYSLSIGQQSNVKKRA